MKGSGSGSIVGVELSLSQKTREMTQQLFIGSRGVKSSSAKNIILIVLRERLEKERIKDAGILHTASDKSPGVLHVSQSRDWEEETVQVLQMSRHHLLRQGVPGGRLAEARLELYPSDGDRVPGEGSGACGRQGH